MGQNILTPPRRTPWWRLLSAKFSDPLIIVLLIAGALALGISCYDYFGRGESGQVFFEPLGIFLAILLATVLSYLFEQRANRAFRLLNQVSDDEPVEVIRRGITTTIPRRDVEVGDTVRLHTGDEVPADGRLTDAFSLSVDESSLTGEPHCVKTTDPARFDPEATYPSDRVLRGTKVMEGHGIMTVTAIGDDTEMGRVYTEAQIDSSVKTPLNEQLDRLARLITKVSYILAALVIIGQAIHFFCFEPWQSMSAIDIFARGLKTLMIAVTLIVVSVPEGLPMAVTLSLAYSMRRMLKTNNLVRKLHACETMGATTVICTDKTGTLTENRMRVAEMNAAGDMNVNIAVNSTANLNGDTVIGNPTEGALLLWLKAQGIDYEELRKDAKVVDEVPFTTERKYMSTTIEAPDGTRVTYIKGAPEIVCAMCGDVPENIPSVLLEYQNRAMRTLAFAERKDDGPVEFRGIVAISDPVRSDVPEAVKNVLDAGIKIKIVTGDTAATAREIARQIGLWNDATDCDRNIATGEEIAAMSDEELRQRAEDLKIIARARPLDKKRLVEALQRNNEVVAVTGDGTNDAPALKAAQVGLSMGDGTSVAKEASDITIVDNSFTSIGRAVMWGRSLYKNIQRFLLFQLTVNVAACLLVLIGSFIGSESPLTITQMLWINLIMDTFGGMALSSLPPSADVMREKPRPRSAFILSRPMIYEILGVGTIFFAITIGFYQYFTHSGGNGIMTLYQASVLFSIFVWTHFWYIFNARAFDTRRSIFRLPMGSAFWAIVIIIVAGQLFITEVAYEFFNVTPMLRNQSDALTLLAIIGASSAVMFVREIWRVISGGR